MSKVQVKPLPSTKWHEKKGVESFTRAKKIQALVNPHTMSYDTGLTSEEEEKYSKILKVDLSNQFVLDVTHSFWDSKMGVVSLENRTQILDTDNPLDFIRTKILKASKYVANSYKEWEEGLFPEATHYIYDETEEVEIEATKVEIRKKAVIESAKLSKDKKINLILVLSADGTDYLKAKNVKGKSENFIEVELDKIIQKRPEDVVRYISMDNKYITLNALIIEALQKNVLEKVGHKIMYHDSVIGQDVNDAIDYLDKPENNDFKIRLMSQVNK